MKTSYRHHEAGYHMEKDIPVIENYLTVYDALELIKKKAHEFTTINYVYLNNDEGKLAGVVSLRELFQAKAQVILSEICNSKLIIARPHTDQERVARLALHNGLKAIPVVDANHVLLGAVTSDNILKILDEEHQEDVLRDGGISFFGKGSGYFGNYTIKKSILVRLPWLVVGLLGGGLAAAVVAYFEEAIATVVLLAAFIPAVVYLADAVGSQTQTLLIRSLAVTPETSYKKYLTKELLVTLGIATLLALLVGISVWYFLADLTLVYILSLTALSTILVTAVISVTLPFLFRLFGSDPAVASGPLATVIRDVSSLLIYFAIAILFI